MIVSLGHASDFFYRHPDGGSVPVQNGHDLVDSHPMTGVSVPFLLALWVPLASNLLESDWDQVTVILVALAFPAVISFLGSKMEVWVAWEF